jgi:hypothetical protein
MRRKQADEKEKEKDRNKVEKQQHHQQHFYPEKIFLAKTTKQSY